MNKILISTILLLTPLACMADYNPFNPNPVVPEQVVTIETPLNNEKPLIDAPKQQNSIDDLEVDDELKALLKRLDGPAAKVKPSDIEFIATANCVDIFYHPNTKTYEERTARACLKNVAKEKIQEELRKIEVNSQNNRGNNVK